MPTSRALPVFEYLRWAALLSLLGAEVLGLTIRFDSGVAKNDLIGLLVGRSRLILQIVIVMAAVGLLLGMRFRRRETESPHPHSVRWSYSYLIAHLATLFAFTRLTSVVLEGGSQSVPAALIWASVWSLMGLATLATWIAIWLPPDRWLALAMR